MRENGKKVVESGLIEDKSEVVDVFSVAVVDVAEGSHVESILAFDAVPRLVLLQYRSPDELVPSLPQFLLLLLPTLPVLQRPQLHSSDPAIVLRVSVDESTVVAVAVDSVKGDEDESLPNEVVEEELVEVEDSEQIFFLDSLRGEVEGVVDANAELIFARVGRASEDANVDASANVASAVSVATVCVDREVDA